MAHAHVPSFALLAQDVVEHKMVGHQLMIKKVLVWPKSIVSLSVRYKLK